MNKAIIGKKVGMTQIFDEKGTVIPVTVIEAGPCVIAQIKNAETDGYNAIQLGYGDVKEKHINKPEQGHFKKANLAFKKHLREFRVNSVEDVKVGDEVKVDVFEAGDKIDVQGTTKGKGFQGVIKRWNQSRGPETHGSTYHRRVGSMGTMRPMRVLKGKKLPGHMGNEQVTIQNLMIVDVDTENKYILVSGNVPGAKNTFVFIREAIKGSKNTPAVELVSYEEVVSEPEVEESVVTEEVVNSEVTSSDANEAETTESKEVSE